ncbi:MAG: leucine-rich repeat protein [Treponema sp.]|nr:leucine-rich repeat protein [Treponema sp.]
MKRFALLLLMAAIFAFAGCQGDSSESETEQAAETPSETSTETPAETTTETPKETETVYHKVSFVSDSGDTIEPQTVESGKTATEPNKPTKTGYTFSAWYDGENAFDFSTPITKDTTLTAKWTANTYTVTLSNNGRENQVSVTFGEKLGDLESVPSMANSSFGGFYTEEYAKGTKFIDSDGKGCKAYDIASDTTLYAAWGYRISYENLMERENPNPEIYTGEEDVALADLENIMGFAFAGWYDAETDGNKVETIAKGESGAKTLYARWETTIFSTVSFDTKGVGEIASQTVGYTDKAVEPENPENYPYDLMGWFTSSDGGETLSENPFDFESEITEDVELYAKWEIHATAADVTDKINAMQKNDTVFVSGEITNDRIKEIGTAIKAKSVEIALDLSDTTGLTSIENKAFYDCKNLASIVIPDGVTSIGSSAFFQCKELTSIVIPDSVTYIGDGAFESCWYLTSIVIPDGVTSIGYGAFENCSSLTSIVIPDSVTSIKSNMFEKCSSLTSIEIPSCATPIRDYFPSYNNITSIKIPSDVTSIGSYAFEECESLTSIEIPSSVTSIGEDAFSRCTNLTSIEIPSSVTSIGEGAFSGCTNLTSIEIPSSVTSIKDDAFHGCSSLTSIEIPSSVTSIRYSAFSDCTNLTSIEIPSGVTSIGDYVFNFCQNLKSIVIPDGVTSIGDSAFSNCSRLTSIEIPSNVTSIGDYAFSCCVLFTSIEIPSNVTSIGKYAFNYCRNLTSLTFLGTRAEWNNITKGENWNKDVPATEVVCSDGVVPLK